MLAQIALGSDTCLARRFAEWSASVDCAKAPHSTISCARRAILDTIGVIAAGAVHNKCRALSAGLADGHAPDRLLDDSVLGMQATALVNGFAAHVWDFDDTSYTGIIHGSAVILPAVLAVAQARNASERDLIEAFLVGSEVAYVLGEICTHSHFLSGWWSTGSCAEVGAVAGLCRLLGLDNDQTASAIGIACVSAAVIRSIAGTDAKPYLVGRAASQAVATAFAAKLGLTGPHDAFEQENGFFQMLNHGHSDLAQVNSLGQRWRIESPGLMFKTSPVCSAAHSAIEATVLLLDDNGFEATDIDRIFVEVPELVWKSLVYSHPSNPQQAQFSLPYAIACAALHGAVRLQDLTTEEIFSEAKQQLTARVQWQSSERLSNNQGSQTHPESAKVCIRLKDGRTVSRFCGNARGAPDRSLTDAELVRKFRDCLTYAGQDMPDFDLQTIDLLDLANKTLCPTKHSTEQMEDLKCGVSR
ncbi:MmgE/PrpD family protein [Pelagibius sp. Alg239-R121]|uniref:MmgE/PrpD family protein n=1 Tax=Pelagibius sp. Alg239-R121 TaxID=2993448 RepID=UPI0024A66BDB|nr:MmgE/PrpD family protein [Pelagibius sp. Alg239-R121]